MAITGFSATLSGSSVGTITGIKEMAVGGISANVINYSTLGDTNKLSNNLQGALTGGAITATIVFDKTLYDTLEAMIKNASGDSWTAEDADGNTWVGDGFISSLGEVSNSPDSENTFAIEITPDTGWEYTAAS